MTKDTKLLKVINKVKFYFNKAQTHEKIILLLAIILVLTFSLYLRERQRVTNLTNIVDSEIEGVVKKVGKLIILPEDLKPDVATIEEADKLRGNESKFYENASDGDKLLIYPDRVILYNPKRNIIVNVAPIISETDEIED